MVLRGEEDELTKLHTLRTFYLTALQQPPALTIFYMLHYSPLFHLIASFEVDFQHEAR